jgi:hypothetical protein
MSFKLIFEFDTIEELMLHVSHMADLEIMNRLVKLPDPPVLEDNRGKHISNLHQRTKQYQLEHPDILYHNCMRIVSKLDKPINE